MDKRTDRPTLVWVELVCAECSDTTGGRWAADGLPVAAIKAEAKSAGWQFVGADAFCSTRCRRSYAQQVDAPPPAPLPVTR